MGQKKFVAFLDILGFKELVEANSQEVLEQVYTEAINRCFKSTDPVMEIMKGLTGNDKIQLHSSIISDSIIFWTERDGPDSFIKLLILVRAFLVGAFFQGIPLRGAIEHGEMGNLDIPPNSDWGLGATPVLVGKALTTAFRWEKVQRWAGCIVTPDAVKHVIERTVKDGLSFQDLYRRGLLLDYAVLVQESGDTLVRQHLQAVNWPSLFALVSKDPELLHRGFAFHGKRISGPRTEQIVQETERFFKHCLDEGRMG